MAQIAFFDNTRGGWLVSMVGVEARNEVYEGY